MTIKYLTGTYARGYSLETQYSGLVLEQRASVGGTGVVATASASVTNFGVVHGSSDGIYLQSGGSLVNGSESDTTAIITGGDYGFAANQVATVANFGTIKALNTSGYGPSGVFLKWGGRLTNGSAADDTALITGGYYGILGGGSGGASTISNFGTIKGVAGQKVGVLLDAGGTVTNGSVTDTGALIAGNYAVLTSSVAATVNNYGTMGCVFLRGGGTVTNGSYTDETALIKSTSYGSYGVLARAPVMIENLGTIQGDRSGVSLQAGQVTNGSVNDTTALITGRSGLITDNPGATVTNYGMILGSKATAVSALNAGTIDNFGTIHGGQNEFGIALDNGGRITNGSVSDTTALIAGGSGIFTTGAGATVTNYGTITAGAGGFAVGFGSVQDVLVVGVAAVFVGAVRGDGGTLDLMAGGASGVGAIFALGNGVLSVRDLAATNTFSDFGTLKVERGAQFQVRGGGRPGGGVLLTNVTDDGLLKVTKNAIDFSQAVGGSGRVKVDHGASAQFDGAAAASLSLVFGVDHGILGLSAPAQFEATIDGFAVGDTIDLLHTAATSATVGPNDTLVIDNGGQTIATLQLSGDYAGDTFSVSPDGAGGSSVTVSTTMMRVGPSHAFASAMAALGGPAEAGHGSGTIHPEVWRPTLAAPRAQIA